MAGQTPETDRSLGGLLTSLVIGAALIVPAMLVLSITSSRSFATVAHGHHIPGYTASLLLFIVPAAVLACWFFRRSAEPERRAFWISLTVLVCITLLLDFVFGPLFFAWPNQDAVIGLMVPAVGGQLPVEEIIFFVSGFAFLLLTYIWCNESWLAAHKSETTRPLRHREAWLLRGALVSLILLTLAAAITYKKLLSSTPEGFPGYLAYVLLVAILPPAYCFPSVSRTINWRAFSFTQLAMALVCLFWEVTLAMPNQWWSFRAEMMTGIYIAEWSQLPIEEPLVWLASPFTVVVVYESVRLRQRVGPGGVRMLLGFTSICRDHR